MPDPSMWPGPDDASDDRSIVQTLIAEQSRLFRSGFGPSVEDYVNRHPFLAHDPEALLDLIRNEIALREEGGEPATLADYESRFPDLAAPLGDLLGATRDTLRTAPGRTLATRAF